MKGALFYLIAAGAFTRAACAAPTFSHDIAPIVFEHCSSCHRPGEAGPFPLLTYDDVKKHATQIADLTHGVSLQHIACG